VGLKLGHIPSRKIPRRGYARRRQKMSLYFHSLIQSAIAAAKVAAGVPAEMKVEMSFAQLVTFLTGKGVEFEIRPTTLEKERGYRAGFWIFSRREVEIYHEPAQEIHLSGIGMIPPFTTFSAYYSERIVGGQLEVRIESVYLSRQGGMRGDEGPTQEVRDFLRGLFPVYRLELPEPLVELPWPKWAGVWFQDQGSGGETYCEVMYLSQARELWAEFIAQDPFGKK
jgi:hypothetical protein